MIRRVVVVATVMVLGVQLHPVRAESDTDFFQNRIRPLFVKHCATCHSSEKGKTSGGRARDTREGWQLDGWWRR